MVIKLWLCFQPILINLLSFCTHSSVTAQIHQAMEAWVKYLPKENFSSIGYSSPVFAALSIFCSSYCDQVLKRWK